MKKLLSLFLALILLLSVPTALAVKPPIPFQGTFPFSKEPIELDVFSMKGVYARGFNDLECWNG